MLAAGAQYKQQQNQNQNFSQIDEKKSLIIENEQLKAMVDIMRAEME